MSDLHVTALGAGPRVVFVHGSMSNGPGAFERQRVLADRFRLELVDRRGFGQTPARAEGVDFDRDADDLLDLLAEGANGGASGPAGPGAHVVGHSYGAVVSLVAAGREPALFRSLTVIEPPAFGLARNDEAARQTEARMRNVFPAPPDAVEGPWYASFLRGIGFQVPDDLPLAGKEQGDIRASMRERFPGEASPDLEAIGDAGVPVLVVRGDWNGFGETAERFGGAAFRAICENVAARTGGRLVVVPGAAHNPQLTEADRFNAELLAFLDAVESPTAEGVAEGSSGVARERAVG